MGILVPHPNPTGSTRPRPEHLPAFAETLLRTTSDHSAHMPTSQNSIVAEPSGSFRISVPGIATRPGRLLPGRTLTSWINAPLITTHVVHYRQI
jgi:hypothetical protein